MSHEPKLTVYIIKLKPINANVENSNRWLFRNLINEVNSDSQIEDSYLITEIFRKFISALDRPEMFSDDSTNKCMTANQPNIEDSNVNPNISFNSINHLIEGKIEGGSYGKRRNKTSTIDKSIKSNVSERDAITDDFYFMLYLPPQSNKMTLLLQSYSDDSIDSVMKKFWTNFFFVEGQFHKPQIKRFVPRRIIDDFKSNSTVSSLSFSTEVPSVTLLGNATSLVTRSYKVTVQVTPVNGDFSLEEFDQVIEPIKSTSFAASMRLGDFSRRKGKLKDNSTDKTSLFELGSSFQIQPTILLSKFITLNDNEDDFVLMKNFCLELLDNIKSEIYTQHAVQER